MLLPKSFSIWNLFLFVFLSNNIFSQQLPLFSLYRENQGLINPASLNSDFLLFYDSYRMSFGATHRSQWIGSTGKITTQSVRGEYIGIGEGSFAPLVGLYMINDQTGPTGFTGIYGRLASIFGIDHPNYGGFSVGLNVGTVQFRVKASEIDLLDPDDVLGQVDQSQWYPDVGLGLYVYKGIGNRGYETGLFYAGLSAAQMFLLDLTFKNDQQEFPLTKSPHYYALAGLYLFLDDDNFVEISGWARYLVNVPFNADINIRYQRRQKFWIGLGSSINGIFHSEFGIYLSGDKPRKHPHFKLGAGFDYALLNSYHGQIDKSFEINLAYLPRWNP